MVMETSSGTVVLVSETELELHADTTAMHAMSAARFTLSI
jgi:hypothetical protein